MNYTIHYNELYSIFNKELPYNIKLPEDLINKIIFKSGFKIIQNLNYIKCFNEFSNLNLNNKNFIIKKTCKTEYIFCSYNYIYNREYKKCIYLKKYILNKIFKHRSENNMDKNKFTINLYYTNLSKIIEEKITYSILKNYEDIMCETREHYLNTTHKKLSVIIMLLNTSNRYYENRLLFYSINTIKKIISKELNIDIKYLDIYESKKQLINYYLTNCY